MKTETDFNNFLESLISENNSDIFQNRKFIFLTFEKYADKHLFNNKFIIYEDWQIQKPEIIKSKVKSILGISERIFARKCTVKKISKPEADNFLNENHIYGTANSKTKYGLFYKNELVSVAVFASQRQFKDGSRSAELIRFCSKNGYSVIGGLDKLLQAYIRKYKPDTLMTYIDLDWGKGDAFLKLGFKPAKKKASITFLVNKKTGERILEKYFSDFENINDYVKFENSGSLKMIYNKFIR
ncbi:MAG: hypothetical protein L3J56_08780 [Bacteroidales bacterium]|nr:hypothetical protein [Bacteroidales bacterium]